MARIFNSLVAIVLLGALIGCTPNPPPRVPGETGLDQLFERLHVTTSADEAQMIEATIRHLWATSEQPEVSKMMSQAILSLHGGDLDGAVALLDQVVALAPDMVAGWNLRATIHYAQDDYAGALSDIAVTLQLEPRHFGAWAGLGLIMQDFDRKQAALRAFETALRYNPHLTDVLEDVRHLRDELSGIPL